MLYLFGQGDLIYNLDRVSAGQCFESQGILESYKIFKVVV